MKHRQAFGGPLPDIVSAGSSAADDAKRPILLVDDNAGDAFLTSERLAEASGGELDVHWVTTAAAATAYLTSRSVDAIILDLVLPDSRSLETLERIKEVSGDALVIVFSGVVDEHLRAAALERGAADVFSKGEGNSRLFPRALLYVLEHHRVQKQHQDLERLLETVPDGILVVDRAGVVRYVNPAALEIFGRRREDFVGELLGVSFRDREPIEVSIPRADGERIAEMRVEPFQWQNGHAFVVSIRDLTAITTSRRKIAESLKLAEDRAALLRRLMDHITALAHGSGLAEVASATAPVLDVRHDEPPSEAVVAGALLPFEVAFRGYAEANARLTVANEQLVAEMAERQRVEAILRQAQKLEAVGRLAAGVAHNFNNVLTAIMGCLGIVEERASTEAVRDIVARGQRAAERGARVARQLLTFARKQHMVKTQVALSERLPEFVALLRQTLREDIAVESEIEPALWCVDIDVSELELALLNICINGRDAMPMGGVLRLVARNRCLDGECPDLHGKYVVIEVSDTGTGIAPEDLPRVFEPFFTTKDFASGSGLGLSQVYGFASQSDGGVQITSEPGHGTTVRLSLPASSKPPAEVETTRPTQHTVSAGGNILIVEDDMDIAEVTREALLSSGFAPKVAYRARAALDFLRSGEEIDLVFSDVIMPDGMNGFELADAVRRHFPRMPILLATGYSDALIEAKSRGLHILSKPYRMDEMCAAIRRIMQRAPARRT